MATVLTKTQVDRLGGRLRKGDITEADLRLLDHYRRSFTEAYEVVVEAIRKELGLEPTGHPAKSTTSISDELSRESIRLSQIQDIAGRLLIVSDVAAQNEDSAGSPADLQERLRSLRKNILNSFRDIIKKKKILKEKVMMFLIEYDRGQGRIVTFNAFDDSARREAEDSRLQLGLKLNRSGTEREVVLPEAATEEALRRTHRRYFEELSELVNLPA